MRTHKAEQGQALIIIVFTIIGLVGITGLVIDGGNAMLAKRSAQNAADAAVMAAAQAYIRGDSTEIIALEYANLNGYSNDGSHSIVEVNILPITYFDGNNDGINDCKSKSDGNGYDGPDEYSFVPDEDDDNDGIKNSKDDDDDNDGIKDKDDNDDDNDGIADEYDDHDNDNDNDGIENDKDDDDDNDGIKDRDDDDDDNDGIKDHEDNDSDKEHDHDNDGIDDEHDDDDDNDGKRDHKNDDDKDSDHDGKPDKYDDDDDNDGIDDEHDDDDDNDGKKDHEDDDDKDSDGDGKKDDEDDDDDNDDKKDHEDDDDDGDGKKDHEDDDYDIDNDGKDDGFDNCVITENYNDGDIYIQVVVTSINETFFAGVVGVPTTFSTSEAIAKVTFPSTGELYAGNAIVALKPTGTATFQNHGNPSITTQGGGLFINSSTDCGYTLNGNPTVSTPSITMVANDSCPTLSGSTITYSAHQEAYPPTGLPNPICSGNAVQSGNTLSPGNFNGTFPPSGVTVLQSGVYCVDGNFRLNGNDTLSGNEVVIVMKSGDVQLNGNGTLSLSAPASGPFNGLLLYLPMSNNNEIRINGTSQQFLTGTILAPASDIVLLGTANTGAFNSQIIGYTVDIGGTFDGFVQYEDSKNFDIDIAPQVALVK